LPHLEAHCIDRSDSTEANRKIISLEKDHRRRSDFA
jgi:hypothetical protein